jgi:hypothetical protein
VKNPKTLDKLQEACRLAKGNQPSVNFINVLRAAFTRADYESAKKDSQVVNLFLHFWDLHMKNLFVER